jgi:hypothetical protein
VCPITTLWSNVTSKLKNIYGLHVGVQPVMMTVDMCHDVVLTSPEGLLILYKSGIFAIDTSIVSFQTWPRHRDDLGVYWKRQKRTYQSPSRPARSYAKCSRGIHASTCKDFWLKSITFLPVAADKNLINCYSIYILKMGRIYIKTCNKINNFQMISWFAYHSPLAILNIKIEGFISSNSV